MNDMTDSSLIPVEMKINISNLCMTTVERFFGSWLVAMFIVVAQLKSI